MASKIKILMVDDHPMILEGYQSTLQTTKAEHQELNIETALDCDSAYKCIIASANKKTPYDVIFFDISLPPSKNGEITSGEDLAKITRQKLPHTKIIILTMFNESFRVHNIIKNINPEGFLIKSDLTSRELGEAFQLILTKPPYYSHTVVNFMKASIVTNIYIDDINRKILHLLSQGIRTKSLSDHVGLSSSAIEKRKKQLKSLFYVEDGNDETLIKNAKKGGFV